VEKVRGKKITRTTVKGFLKRNEGKLYLRVTSRFDGMQDCVAQLDGDFAPAIPTTRHLGNSLGIEYAWFVGGGRDYFSLYEDEKYEGICVSNCCGDFILAVKKPMELFNDKKEEVEPEPDETVTEDAPETVVPAETDLAEEEAIIAKAKAILDGRLRKGGYDFSGAEAAKDYCLVHQPNDGREHFTVLFLDIKNRLVESRTLSVGTVAQATVYPREVLRACIEANASGVILCHNHPSGSTEASAGDRDITAKIKAALSYIDVRLLDHIIVAGGNAVSMAQKGWM